MDPALQQKLDSASDLTFDDPKLSRAASNAAGTKNLEAARQKRQMGKEKPVHEDRDNPEMEEIIAADPTEFMRKRLTKMMVRELAINDTLYSMTPPDHKAISDSNKRVMDLGDALKALPNQSSGSNVGSQLSLSEAIQQAIARRVDAPVVEPINHPIKTAMMDRAESSFGVDK